MTQMKHLLVGVTPEQRGGLMAVFQDMICLHWRLSSCSVHIQTENSVAFRSTTTYSNWTRTIQTLNAGQLSLLSLVNGNGGCER